MSTLLSLQYQGEQVKNAKLQNKFLDETIDSRVDAEKIKTHIAQAESMIKSYEQSDRLQKNLYNKFFGINDSMTPDERNAAIINRLFKIISITKSFRIQSKRLKISRRKTFKH